MAHENLYRLSLKQQEETAHRLLNDVGLQRMGAVGLANGRLEVTREQNEAASTETSQKLSARTPVNTELSQEDIGKSTEQAVGDHEMVQEVLQHSGVTVKTYLHSGIIPHLGMRWHYLHGPTTTEGDAVEFDRVSTPGVTYDTLNSKGVSEIVTFTNLLDSWLFDRVPGHKGENGDLTVMSYEMTHGQRGYGSGHRSYPMGLDKGAPGATHSHHLFMPPLEASKLRAAITERPELLHELTDTMMIEGFGASPEGWRKYGLQYDAWREADGGELKLAMRDSFEDPVEDKSLILTY